MMLPFSGIARRTVFSSMSITILAPIIAIVAQSFTDLSVLEHVRRLPHARATYKQLVREMRLHGEKRDDLDEALNRLCDKGLLAELRSGHFVAVGENTEYVAGRLSIHRDGFG